jgi:hypothetical protein
MSRLCLVLNVLLRSGVIAEKTSICTNHAPGIFCASIRELGAGVTISSYGIV